MILNKKLLMAKRITIGLLIICLFATSGCVGSNTDTSTGDSNNYTAKEQSKDPDQKTVYITKKVSEMSKEERYKEIVRTLEGAEKFFRKNFFTDKELENISENWLRKKRQIFLRDYYHRFHILCAEELAKSLTRTELDIAESQSGKPVWFIDHEMRNWIKHMDKRRENGYPVSLQSLSQFQNMVDTFKENNEPPEKSGNITGNNQNDKINLEIKNARPKLIPLLKNSAAHINEFRVWINSRPPKKPKNIEIFNKFINHRFNQLDHCRNEVARDHKEFKNLYGQDLSINKTLRKINNFYKQTRKAMEYDKNKYYVSYRNEGAEQKLLEIEKTFLTTTFENMDAFNK